MTDEYKILLEEVAKLTGTLRTSYVLSDVLELVEQRLRVVFQDTPATRVICDETNNSQEDIENGVVNVTIIPYISVERITCEIVVKKDD